MHTPDPIRVGFALGMGGNTKSFFFVLETYVQTWKGTMDENWQILNDDQRRNIFAFIIRDRYRLGNMPARCGGLILLNILLRECNNRREYLRICFH
jgi:hypothetical protein